MTTLATSTIPHMVGKVLNFASMIEPNTLAQAQRTADLDFVEPHLALMPDAHLGFGATVGSVIPTRGAVIPAAVGVDIGCGMEAVRLTLTVDDLPELGPVHDSMRRSIPAGVGQGHDSIDEGRAYVKATSDQAATIFDHRLTHKAASQFGTLGSGNHFVELSADQDANIWLVLHSGSRGIGNLLAQRHINIAKAQMNKFFITLDDPDLAYLVEDTAEFDAYLDDVEWAQEYARAQRMKMVTNLLAQIRTDRSLPSNNIDVWFSAHHNYIRREHHFGQNMYVTRKGAIDAHEGVPGIIPGSMADSTYLVEGLGHIGAIKSAPHGAGRLLSRTAAKREHSSEELTATMKAKGIIWNDRDSNTLVDEIPNAYKPIAQVMEDARDLVRVTHELKQLVNYKGT